MRWLLFIVVFFSAPNTSADIQVSHLALGVPVELKLLVEPPEGRIFNEMAPSKFLVRISGSWQKEGTLKGTKSLVSLPPLQNTETRTLEINISYFHCDKLGLSQCVRESKSRMIPVLGSTASKTNSVEVVFR